MGMANTSKLSELQVQALIGWLRSMPWWGVIEGRVGSALPLKDLARGCREHPAYWGGKDTPDCDRCRWIEWAVEVYDVQA